VKANLIYPFVIIAQGIFPVLGLFIILFEVNVKKRFMTVIKIVFPTIGIVYCVLEQLSNPAYSVYWQFPLYGIAISVFLHFLQARNPDNNTKVLGLTLIVAHLFSQYWEIPIFIMVHLGFLDGYLGSIDQLYLILVFYLALRFSNISIAKRDLMILSTPLIFTTLAYYLALNFNPVVMSYVPYLWFYARFISCFCLGKFFIERSDL